MAVASYQAASLAAKLAWVTRGTLMPTAMILRAVRPAWFFGILVAGFASADQLVEQWVHQLLLGGTIAAVIGLLTGKK